MKRFMIIMLALIMAVSVTGCWDNMEYENMALVRTITFDVDSNGEYVASVEIVKSEGTGRGLNMTGTEIGEVRTAKGATVVEAMDGLQKEIQYEMFLGYTTCIILSEKLDKKKMEDVVNYLYITPDIRESVFVVVCDGSPGDILHKGIMKRKLIGDQIQDSFKSLPRTGVAFPVKLAELNKMLLLNGVEPILPQIEVVETGYIKVSKMVAFKGYERIGIFDEKEARGWGIIEGKKVNPWISIHPLLSD